MSEDQSHPLNFPDQQTPTGVRQLLNLTGATSAVAPPSGPVTPIRTAWLDMPAEYGAAGMKLRVWINYPAKLGEKIAQSEDHRDLSQRLERLRRRAERESLPDILDALERDIQQVEDELADVTKRDETARIAALSRIVTEHNGWVQGEDDPNPGAPYPPANTPEFWEVCSAELSLTILMLLGRAIQELPLSVGRQSRSGRR